MAGPNRTDANDDIFWENEANQERFGFGKGTGGGNELIALSDFFYNNYGIDGTDWAKTFGYSFVVYDRSSGAYRSLALPLSPQSISIDVPAATNLSVTMKGIVEENNGAPLRRISIRGTSGVIFASSSNPPNSSGPTGLMGSLFRNTINSAGKVVGNYQKLKGSFGDSGPRAEPLNHDVTNVPNSGYLFIHGLINFLDQYLAMKKQKKHKNVRLQFLMHKDRMYWDCTLTNYSVRKLPGTLEYEYDISLTAWRRSATPAGDGRRSPEKISQTPSKDLNGLAKLLNGLKNARKLINSSVGVLTGIRSDVDQSLMGPMREAMMMIGEAVGAVHTLIDFPGSLINSMKASIEQSIVAAKGAALSSDQVSAAGKTLQASGMYATTAVQSSAIQYQSFDVLDSLAAETESQSSTGNSSPMDTLFNDQINYQNFLDSFTPDSLNVTPEVQNALQAEIDRVSAFTIEDLASRRQLIEEYANSISAGLGGTSSTFNRVNAQPTKTTYKTLSTDDITLLNAMNDIIMGIDAMSAYLRNQVKPTSEDYYEYYAQLAIANEIPFTTSQSKFFVPFPYGASLESLAVQYLGSADRWIEIAALNGLKAPYIDEDGFIIPFRSSGNGNSCLIPYNTDIYIGQIVELASDSQPISVRKINSIDTLSSIEMIVTFNGTNDLNKYTISDNARINAYLPDTVNSLKLVAIPSGGDVSDVNRIKTSPGRDDLDFLTSMAKIDLLLTTDGDLALDGTGDFKESVGLQNLFQAAMIKLQTKVGTLVNDPQFGNPAQAGASIAELNAKDLIKRLSGLFKDDPRFGPILAASAQVVGGSVTINILIKVADLDYHLPLSVQVPL
jgi:hypothetical protein